MSYLIVCAVALVASGQTFLSGFGLGTLLLPAFAVLFAVEQAVALTAVVHFLIDISRLGVYSRLILERQAEFDQYGLLAAAVIAAFAGAVAGNRSRFRRVRCRVRS